MEKQIIENCDNASFCIIVPMYNEQDNVIPCVKTICNFLKNIENRCELLVVNDGSDDKTHNKLLNFKKNPQKIKYKITPYKSWLWGG